LKTALILTPALKSGHPTIDAEHQDLFDRTNALIDILGRGDREAFVVAFEALCERIEMHFQSEIAVLREVGFPEAEEHAKLHEKMAVGLDGLRRDYHARDSLVSGDEFHEAIVSFLIHDIIHEDIEFKSFLTEQGYTV